ncbi:unnamed protein product, partial [Closterium sp. NIES-54]
SPRVACPASSLACAAVHSLRRGSAARCPSLLLIPPHHGSLIDLALGRLGPSLVLGPRQERYFLIVVDDYSRYTTVFPLRRKANVPTVLEPWLLARGGVQGLCGLHLHSDCGGEFSSTRLETFCQGRRIIQSYTLPDSLQQNGVAERRIGLIMEVARTSMCHAGAPQFLWPQAVRYAAHQLNMWPSDARPRVMPIFLWTGFSGVAGDYRVWGCLAHVRAPGVNKLSARTRVCVFLGFPLDASGWVFYDPVTHHFFASQDVTFDDVSHVTLQSSPPQRLVPVVSGGAGGAVAEGEGTGAARARRASSGGAGGVRLETTPEEDTTVSTQLPWGVVTGGSGSGGAGAGDMSTATPTPRTVPAAAAAAAVTAVSVGASRESRGGVAAAAAAAVSVGALGESRGVAAAAAVSVGASGESRGVAAAAAAAAAAPPPPPPPPTLAAAAAAAAAALSVGASGESRGGVTSAARASTWTRRSPLSRAVSPEPRRSRYRADGPFHLVLRSRVPSPPVLPQPLESSLTVLHDPLSDYLHASRPVVSHVLSELVTHPTAPLSSVSALVTTIVGFASSRRLDYTAHLVSGPARSPSSGGALVYPLQVLEDRQFELAEEAEMASYRSTCTYVAAVPPLGANVVSGMWLYKVKRLPGAPPLFKACYVARGFSQREGLDFFQTFAPTPKMTTLRVLLHIAAQRDYELHSLDFSSAFLQGVQPTPLAVDHGLTAPPLDEPFESSGPYPELVGCLMVANYVAITSGMGLVLGGKQPVTLTGYSDSSWADDAESLRSTQGYCFGLGAGAVSWRSIRASSVSSSNCEAELYAAAMAAQELRWLSFLLTDLGERPRSLPVLFADNRSAILLCGKPCLVGKAKHIQLRYFLLREFQQRGQAHVVCVVSEANTADIFTKALPPCAHQRCCTQLGLESTGPHLLA